MKIMNARWNIASLSLKSRACTAAALLGGLAGLLPGAAQGTDVAWQKLYGHWTIPASALMGYPFSVNAPNALASNDAWILVGAPYSNDSASFGGTVQVFNAVTGAWVRKIAPPAPLAANIYFGNACAVQGSTAVIGSAGVAGNTGAAYVYNLATGAKIRALVPNTGEVSTNDLFGYSTAIAGNRAAVGAYNDDSAEGSVYIFNVATGAEIAKVQPPAPNNVANCFFGFTLAAEGNILLVGAPGADSNRGCAFAYDLTTGNLIGKYQPAGGAANEYAGWSVALHQGKAVIGAPQANSIAGKVYVMGLQSGNVNLTLTTLAGPAANDNLGFSVSVNQGLLAVGAPGTASGKGAVYIYDLNSSLSTEIQKLVPTDTGGGGFGYLVSLWNNRLVTSAPLDGTQAGNAGALYVGSPIMRAMPMTKMAARGDFAPGAVDSNFATIGDAYINPDAEVAIASTTAGAGSNAGHDVGVWDSLATGSTLDLVLKSRLLDGGLTIASVSAPLINYTDTAVLRATLTGTGVTSLSNQAIYKDNGTTATRLFRTGDAQPVFTNAVPSAFTQVVHSQGANRIAATVTLRQGLASTTATNDSGLLWYDVTGATSEAQREGSPVGLLTYGQFTGRVACYYNQAGYTTAITGATAFNQAVFQKIFGSAPTLIARKGDPAPGIATPPPLSAFLGETVDDSNVMMYRATLGAPATTANNEGLWTYTVGTPALRMRKGDLVPGLTNVKIAKFITTWLTNQRALALVQLTGTGVTAANDQALIVYQLSGPLVNTLQLLLREGDLAPGCNGATIGVISRVQLEPYWGHYYVLATLAGAPAGTELVLLRGYSSRGSATLGQTLLDQPVTVLRKGHLFANQPGKITSMSFPSSNLPASGVGNIGLGLVAQHSAGSITPSNLVIAVDFANGVHQVMRGIP